MVVESAPAVPSGAPVSKLGRAEGGMKPPSARPAKKARQDAFDPMDPVSVSILFCFCEACEHAAVALKDCQTRS